MLQVKCPNCQSIIDANDVVPQMSCPHCGKTYSNPYYNPDKPVQKAQAQQHPINQAPQPHVAAQPQRQVQPRPVQNTVQPQQQRQIVPQQQPRIAKRGKSEFTGGLGSLIGLRIVNTLILIFTIGLGTPWVICRSYRWKVEHQIYDGYKIVFDGKAGSLFGQWLKWVFLTIITIGIYSFWIPIKKLKWITEHSHIEY